MNGNNENKIVNFNLTYIKLGIIKRKNFYPIKRKRNIFINYK